MSRLIDADTLIKKMLREQCHYYYTNDDIEFGYHKCIRLVYEAPTVDAEPIVRCKDCKYWAEFTFAQPPKNYCGRLIQADYNNHNFGFEMDADDFCSKGEKR